MLITDGGLGVLLGRMAARAGGFGFGMGMAEILSERRGVCVYKTSRRGTLADSAVACACGLCLYTEDAARVPSNKEIREPVGAIDSASTASWLSESRPWGLGLALRLAASVAAMKLGLFGLDAGGWCILGGSSRRLWTSLEGVDPVRWKASDAPLRAAAASGAVDVGGIRVTAFRANRPGERNHGTKKAEW